MGTNKSFSIGNDMKFTDMVAINPEFTLAKCYVQAVGKNRNYTNMSEESINKALPTLGFVPVVAHCFKDENGEYRLGGHDYTIDNDFNIVAETVPFGVVKPNTYNWEMVEEYGKEVKYLTCEVVLWTGRYPKLMETAYNDEVMWNQSMEINANQYRPLDEDSNYTDILDFSYSALCLLNKSDNKAENVEPCFINARVETFSSDEFLAKLAELKNEIFNLKEEGETMTENETPISENPISEEMTVETTVVEESSVTEETIVEESTVEEAVDYSAIIETMQTEIDNLKAENASLTAQVAELEPYRNSALQAEKEAVFAKYESKIGEMSEFATLKEKIADYTAEELDRECLMLVGKFAMQKAVETPVEESIKFSAIDETPNNENVADKKYQNAFTSYRSK